MKKYRVDIITVESSDQKAINGVQQKINQWITTGALKKFELHTTATHCVFNICRLKEQGE